MGPIRTITLLIPGMGCRRCVREVTSRLRDVPGVQVLVADGAAHEVVVTGSMSEGDLLSAFAGSDHSPAVIARHGDR